MKLPGNPGSSVYEGPGPSELMGNPGAAAADHVPEPLWLVDQVARFLGVSKYWVYRQAESGLLPYRKIGGNLRFIPDELRRWVETQPGRGPEVLSPGRGR